MDGIAGAPVAHLATHLGLRNLERSIARVHDPLHAPARNKALIGPAGIGSGGNTHRYASAAPHAARWPPRRVPSPPQVTRGYRSGGPDYQF